MKTSSGAKKLTVHDLAVLAGTSASTVSAVLNGSWQRRRISQKLADHVNQIAEQHGYAANMQARALRRARSGIIGMLLPMYDNRYFSSIAQKFEDMARARGLFPIVTCTQRDPRLEMDAARALLAYQVEYLICTGATDPNRITRICTEAGVPTINLDLPGTLAPSIISDNFAGARQLAHTIFDRISASDRALGPLMFVGGRGNDHNTSERLHGFRAAHEDRGIAVKEDAILTTGYSADIVADALARFVAEGNALPDGIFVNSTISFEGVIRWMRTTGHAEPEEHQLGCFDWDPFAELLGNGIPMIRQDVRAMLDQAFRKIDAKDTAIDRIEIPTILMEFTRAKD